MAGGRRARACHGHGAPLLGLGRWQRLSTPGTSLVQRGEDDEEARSPCDRDSGIGIGSDADVSDSSDDGDGDHAAIVTAVRPSAAAS